MEPAAGTRIARLVLCSLTALLAGCAGTRESTLGWEEMNGPIACDVSAVLVDHAQPGTVYAGLTTGAIYSSTDTGQTWKIAGTLPGSRAVNALAQDPENSARILAATNAGAFLSVDRGATWKDLQIGGANGVPILTLAIDPWKPTVVFAGTRGRGLYRSTDGGTTWSPIVNAGDATFSFADVYDIDIDLAKPDVLYAALSGIGLARSNDGGVSWMRVSPEASPSASAITHVLLRPSGGNEVLYGTAAGSIFLTIDGGNTWAQVRRGLEVDRILSLESLPKAPETVYAGTLNGILRSTDFGTTWTQVGDTLPRVPTSVALPRAPGNPTMFAFGEGLGVITSSDSAATWTLAQRGLGGSTVSQLLSDSTGTRVYAATGTTVLRHDRASGSWVPAGSGLTGGVVKAFASDPDSASGMYAATPAGVYHTSNGGASWRAVPRRLPVAPVFLDSHPTIGTRVFASGEQGLFVSTDRGNSWGQVKPLGNRFSVKSLTFAPVNAGIIFGAGTTGVIATTDGGMNWTPARFGLSGDETIAITFGTPDGQTCYAWTTRGEGFKSVNRGLEWSAIKTPWGKGGSLLVAFDRFRPSDAIAILNGKELYHTTDGGGSWVPVKGIDVPFDVTALHWNSRTATLMAGARGSGVKTLPLRRLIAASHGV